MNKINGIIILYSKFTACNAEWHVMSCSCVTTKAKNHLSAHINCWEDFYGKNLQTHTCDKEEIEWNLSFLRKGLLPNTSQKYHDNSSFRDFHEKLNEMCVRIFFSSSCSSSLAIFITHNALLFSSLMQFVTVNSKICTWM